jgi:hypothetical protein
VLDWRPLKRHGKTRSSEPILATLKRAPPFRQADRRAAHETS